MRKKIIQILTLLLLNLLVTPLAAQEQADTTQFVLKGDIFITPSINNKTEASLLPETLKHNDKRLKVNNSTAETPKTSVKPYSLALRANLLNWITLTYDLGVQWRINQNWSIELNGWGGSRSWDQHSQEFSKWRVSSEIHYYLGKRKRWYMGAVFNFGQSTNKIYEKNRINRVISQNSGIIGGYMLPIKKHFIFDFSFGVGYTHLIRERYSLIEHEKVLVSKRSKNKLGLSKIGATLIWKIF